MGKNRFFCIWIVVAGLTLQAFTLTAQQRANTSSTSKDKKKEIPNYYSLDQEIELGKEFSRQVDATAVFIHDPVVVEYISQVGQNLVRNSAPQFTFTFRIIDSPEPRAFALPGGIVYINSGLLRAADNEAEFAAVVSHAVAHVNARHVTRMFSGMESMNSTHKHLQNKSDLPDYCSIYAMCEKDDGTFVPPVFVEFSRGFETEADWLGVQYVYKAGYHPNGFLSFLARREQIEKKAPSSTHPATADRISVIEKEIVSILKARERYTVDTEEFQTIKTRLSNLKTQGLHATAKR